MPTESTPRRPTRLRTDFYVWLRRNHEAIVRLVMVDKYSHRALISELGWGTNADVPLALRLLTAHEKSVAEGDWRGVEKELFGVYSYYEKLPSVQRAFHELKDRRAVGKAPLAARPRPKRAKGQGKGTKKDEGAVAPDSTANPTLARPAAPLPPQAAPAEAKPAAPHRDPGSGHAKMGIGVKKEIL